MTLEFWEMVVLKLENANEAAHGDSARTQQSLKSQFLATTQACIFRVEQSHLDPCSQMKDQKNKSMNCHSL